MSASYAAIGESTPSRYDLTANVKAIRYEEVSVYPVRGVDDEKGLAIIRVTDRTKQIIMERELIQSEKLASLGLLISGIVHEINNPNNFIVFNIPILRDYLKEILPIVDVHAEKDPMYEVQGMAYPDFRTDVMKLLDNIEHGSHRINVTVAKLKEFSRKREDKGMRAVASAEVVNKALSICHTQIRKTVKTFDVEVDPPYKVLRCGLQEGRCKNVPLSAVSLRLLKKCWKEEPDHHAVHIPERFFWPMIKSPQENKSRLVSEPLLNRVNP